MIDTNIHAGPYLICYYCPIEIKNKIMACSKHTRCQDNHILFCPKCGSKIEETPENVSTSSVMWNIPKKENRRYFISIVCEEDFDSDFIKEINPIFKEIAKSSTMI